MDIKKRIGANELAKSSSKDTQPCTQCKSLLSKKIIQQNLHVCPYCDFHFPLPVYERIALLSDTFAEVNSSICSSDILTFTDTVSYEERLRSQREKSGRNEAVVTGVVSLKDIEFGICVFDFTFMGGSMGSGVGEKITRLIELSIQKEIGVVIVSASGGARMQESVYSLLQMAKITSALLKLSEAKLPYVSIITNPTTGGVTASFASIGDVILAEPGALFAFTGPRVIEQTLKQTLPEGAQKAEFALQHGMIDAVVERKNLKQYIHAILSTLS